MEAELRNGIYRLTHTKEIKQLREIYYFKNKSILLEKNKIKKRKNKIHNNVNNYFQRNCGFTVPKWIYCLNPEIFQDIVNRRLLTNIGEKI